MATIVTLTMAIIVTLTMTTKVILIMIPIVTLTNRIKNFLRLELEITGEDYYSNINYGYYRNINYD